MCVLNVSIIWPLFSPFANMFAYTFSFSLCLCPSRTFIDVCTRARIHTWVNNDTSLFVYIFKEKKNGSSTRNHRRCEETNERTPTNSIQPSILSCEVLMTSTDVFSKHNDRFDCWPRPYINREGKHTMMINAPVILRWEERECQRTWREHDEHREFHNELFCTNCEYVIHEGWIRRPNVSDKR